MLALGTGAVTFPLGSWLNPALQIREEGPFYAVLKDFLAPPLYQELMRAFPRSGFAKISARRDEKSYTMEVLADPKSCELGEPWSRLLADLSHSDSIRHLSELFNVELSTTDPEINLWRYGRSDFLDAHVDKPYKKLTLLVYMTAAWQGEWGGQLVLMKDAAAGGDILVYPEPNVAVFLKRTDSSWHRVAPVVTDEATRVCLQVIYK